MKCQKQVVFYSGGSRPSDWGGGGGGLKKICFRSFGPQFRLDIRRKGVGGGGGGRGPPLDPPLFSAFIISFG